MSTLIKRRIKTPEQVLRQVLTVLHTAYDLEPETLTMLGFDKPMENLMYHLDNPMSDLGNEDEALLEQVERYEADKAWNEAWEEA